MKEQVLIYETGGKNVRVCFEEGAEMIWVSQAQMAEMFDVTQQNIAASVRNIYKEGELERARTCKEERLTQEEGGRSVKRKVKLYNLDVVIAVGYRVSSRKATDFRIWASRMLRQYMVEGVAVNERRMAELTDAKLKEAEKELSVIKKLMAQRDLLDDEATGIREVIIRYAKSFRTLSEYDGGFIRLRDETKAKKMLEAGECMEMIDQLREELGAGEMFGKPRGDSFEGALRTIYQNFGGEDMYPTLAEKAANLLYFVIKDHPFFDGNKRIAALLFVMFLILNEYNITETGELKISDRTLTAITLMIAESEPREKGLLTAVVCRLIEE